jgi:beta-galactosidase
VGASGVGGRAGAAGGAAGSGGTGGGAGAYTPPAAIRTDTLLDTGWRFLRSDATGASATAFDDASWTAVTVPHTWNASDGQDGGNNYYRGIGWYRRHVSVPAAAAGKRLFLQFDAANIVADVWVNGTSLGQHRGGFSRFRYDVTSAMRAGADNVIAVRVSNAAVTDVAPLDADFTFFGGLYREVRLIATEPLHVDLLDYASPGVYVSATGVSAASASLRVRIRVRNDGAAAQTATATAVLVHADGQVAARLGGSANVVAGATQEIAVTGTVTSPHLWNGVADPYLYTVYAEVATATGVVDWVAVPFGFRSFAVDAAQGFTLNGQYVDLHGVNRHQDRLGMGWAISAREHDEDMALIRELGANIIRLSHYQHADYFHTLADKAGTVLWAEIPLVNQINTAAAFTNNARQQIIELIRQNYNHPSIVMWGIGNEQRSDNAATNDLLTNLNSLVKTEDPTRLSTYAQCCTPDTGGLPAHADIVGYNTYFGWYDAFGTADMFGAWADGLHAARPAWKIGISEYGAGGALSQHAEPPVRPDPYGEFHPEEWQNLVHEKHWLQMKTRRWLWSKIIWNMFDFAVDSRDEGEATGRNDKGLVSYDRKTRKDAFYWYKANWTTAPFVYISSRRFATRTTATVPVKVYSNMTEVDLRVNGTAVSTLTAADRIFLWPSVALRTGANTIEVTGRTGSTMQTDTVTWMRN